MPGTFSSSSGRILRKELETWERGGRTEFSDEMFERLIDQGTVKPEGTIVFRFKCGLELEEACSPKRGAETPIEEAKKIIAAERSR